MRVVVDGYEGGVGGFTIKKVPIKLNVNEKSYYGRHEPCPKGEQDEVALYIRRKTQ
jgi:hypothetical protein